MTYCKGFPETCPCLLSVDPDPPQHFGGFRCGCGDLPPLPVRATPHYRKDSWFVEYSEGGEWMQYGSGGQSREEAIGFMERSSAHRPEIRFRVVRSTVTHTVEEGPHG